MDKVVDRKHGEGKLLQGDTVLHEVTYSIIVYQEFYETLPHQPPIPGLMDIQGTISFKDDVPHPALMRQVLTLVLQDGTKMDLQLGPNGEIITRKGFY